MSLGAEDLPSSCTSFMNWSEIPHFVSLGLSTHKMEIKSASSSSPHCESQLNKHVSTFY